MDHKKYRIDDKFRFVLCLNIIPIKAPTEPPANAASRRTFSGIRHLPDFAFHLSIPYISHTPTFNAKETTHQNLHTMISFFKVKRINNLLFAVFPASREGGVHNICQHDIFPQVLFCFSPDPSYNQARCPSSSKINVDNPRTNIFPSTPDRSELTRLFKRLLFIKFSVPCRL